MVYSLYLVKDCFYFLPTKKPAQSRQVSSTNVTEVNHHGQLLGNCKATENCFLTTYHPSFHPSFVAGGWQSNVFIWVTFVMQPKWQQSVEIFKQIWLQAKYENNIQPSIFLATVLKPCSVIWKVLLNFGLIMAFLNVKKYLILALLLFNFSFWLQITSTKKGFRRIFLFATGSKFVSFFSSSSSLAEILSLFRFLGFADLISTARSSSPKRMFVFWENLLWMCCILNPDCGIVRD